MIFLIEYDRQRAQIVYFKSYTDAESNVADDERLALELELNRQRIEHEVVLLQAKDEAALRRTHRRYFEDIRELVEMVN